MSAPEHNAHPKNTTQRSKQAVELSPTDIHATASRKQYDLFTGGLCMLTASPCSLILSRPVMQGAGSKAVLALWKAYLFWCCFA